MKPASGIAVFLTIIILVLSSWPALAQDTAGDIASDIANSITGLGAGLPALISSNSAAGTTSYSLSL